MWGAAAACLVAGLTGAPATAAEERDVLLAVPAVVVRAVPDTFDGSAQPAGTAEVLTMVEVDGVLHDLTGEPELAGARTGADVVLTLEVERGVTAREALEQIAEDDPGVPDTARLVDVTPPAGGLPPEREIPPKPVVLGQHTLTILPVYTGVPDGETVDSLAALADKAARYWADQSAGELTLTPTVLAWKKYTAPATCDPTTIMKNALTAHGSPPVSATQHVVVYFPKRADCGWDGLGTIGGGSIWVNGVGLEDVLTHELGHNFGLGHANVAHCAEGGTRVPLNTSGCDLEEYADTADVMGFGTSLPSGNLTTAAADSLGLAQVRRLTATSPGAPVTVDLAPLAEVDALRSVAIDVPDLPGERIYVDFRPAQGRDLREPGWSGVQVHLWTPDRTGAGPQTYLLDMSPRTTVPFTSPALAVGRSWTVPGTDLAVTVVSVGTTARITVGPPVVPPPGLPEEGTPDRTPPTRAVVTAPTAGAVVRGTVTVRWAPSTDTVGVTGYDVVVDGRPLGRVGSRTTWATIEGFAPGPHTVAVDAVDAAGNRAAGARVAFTAVTYPTQEYVARVYRDLFGRAPDAAGLVGWSRSLDAGTPRVAVANAITASDEYRSRLIGASYRQYLDRGADSGGLASWLRAMRSGMTIQEMQVGFVASPEYYAQSGSDDARWVTRLYQHVLGRTPAAAEVRHWQRQIAGGLGRGQVARGFLLSTEHLTTVVDGHYRHLLGRGIDPTGARSWVTAIQRGTRVESIVGGIIASGEYAARS